MGKTIPIDYDEYEVDTTKTAKELGGNWGLFVHNKNERKIYVANDHPTEEAAKSTLVHEIIEGFKFHRRINMREVDVEKMEPVMYQFLKFLGIDLSGFLDFGS